MNIKVGQVITDNNGWEYMIIQDMTKYKLLCLNNGAVQFGIVGNSIDEITTKIKSLGHFELKEDEYYAN